MYLDGEKKKICYTLPLFSQNFFFFHKIFSYLVSYTKWAIWKMLELCDLVACVPHVFGLLRLFYCYEIEILGSLCKG